MTKTKIVLDADVIIHFMKGERFYDLLNIFPEYLYIILDVVYEELSDKRKAMIDNATTYFKDRLVKEVFSPSGESAKDFAFLTQRIGNGESACMVYCRDHHDVLGSSNLRDIREYCQKYLITYLTTIDFLYYAYVRKKMTPDDIREFIKTVVEKGSNLPITDIEKYAPSCSI